MKSRLYLLLFSFIILLSIDACNDDDITDDPGISEPDPITPDLTVKVTASVAGFVIDESGSPVVYANVLAGEKQVSTDEFGYFKITNTSLAEFAGLVKVSKNGYFEGYETFVPEEGKQTFVRVKLLAKTDVGIINATSGGTATTIDGATVSLPANAVVVASNNTSYTGEVHVNVRLINPSDSQDNDLSADKPGDSRGINEEGYIKALKSFSTIAVELLASNGQLLQIAAGKSATITLPIPSALAADAPASIDLWSFDTATGLWKKEGSATKTGNTYVGTVTHFSFWEGAEGIPLVNFTARIVDASAQPLANVPVTITIAGMPKNAGHGRFGYTDANGYITGAVFANTNLVLDIATPCAISAYSHEFATAAADIDLGTLTGNLGQNMVTLSGTVVNCNNQPVTNGYIQTYDNGFYNRIAINNGSFTFTGLVCTNTEVNIVVVDNTTLIQNTPKTVTINPGANNLGTITACGTSTVGYIYYIMDGDTLEILEPADTLGAYNLEPDGAWTQILTMSGNPNEGQRMAFQFDGGTTTGTGHKLTEVFSTAFPSGRGYWPAPITVTISEYQSVGGFISGSFSSTMLDFGDNSIHTFYCSFRVRRRV